MRIRDNYSIISGAEMMDKLSARSAPEIRDFTDNGKCRGCGNCCGNYIPLSAKDVYRIKTYIHRNNIRPSKPLFVSGPWEKPTVHNQCPFLLDKDDMRCAIYPARPDVCRAWSCHDPIHNASLMRLALQNTLKTINMYETFYPLETLAELLKVRQEGK